jgi:co-chaperonin GroES (HSP10)
LNKYANAISPDQVKPIGKNVLLKRHTSNADDTLIITPDNRIEKNLKCTVLAVNPGTYIPVMGTRVQRQAKVGDVVLVRQWRGILLNPQDQSVIFVSEDLIEGIVESEAGK